MTIVRATCVTWALAMAVACGGDDTPAGTGGSSSSGGDTTTVGTSVDPTTDASGVASTVGSASSEASSGGSGDASSTAADSGGSSSGGITCNPGEFGPQCLPCTCVNGSCDEGAAGTGACTCDVGFAGDACDELDCGPGGTLGDDGACTTPLVAIEDTQVVSGEFSGTNYGADQFTPFAVGQQNDFTGNQIGRALIKFDLSALPPSAVVDSAVLHIAEYDNFAGFPMTIVAKGAGSNWDEGTVTFDSQPNVAPFVFDSAVVGCCGEAHELEVTMVIVAALEGMLTEATIELQSEDETVVGGVRWWMREGDGVDMNGIVGAAPQLVVHWSMP